MSPVTPSDFKALIPTSSGNVCDRFLKALYTMPQRFYDFYSYMFDEDGNFSDTFVSDICAIDCSTVSPGGGSGIAAPTITYTPGNPPRFSWNTISGAAFYELARNTENNLATAELLTTTTLNFFDDITAVSGDWYFYWVRGVSGSTLGSWSAMQLGGNTPTTLAAPGSLACTTTNPNYVEVTWAVVPGATSYKVFRNTSNTTVGATLLGTTNVLWHHDFTGTLSVSYYYFCEGINAYNNGSTTTGVVGERT